MVVVTLGGGLGNQLFQYVTAKQLAFKNNTTLKLYINNFKYEIGRCYKLSYYNIEEVLATDSEVEKLIGNFYENSLYAKWSKKINRFRPKYKRRYYIEDNYWGYEPQLMKISSNVLLEGFWQHYKYYENIPPLINRELTLKEPFMASSINYLNDILEDNSSVSLHIRRGDYVSDRNNLNFFGVVPIDYYYSAINYIKGKINDPKLYIFSDDLMWAKDNLIMDVPMTFVDIDGGTKDFIELEAMSRCRHNIIANSSFSWWGAFLNKYKDKIVIAPKNWVVREDINSRIEIQLPTWITL